jgi:hypothetical protein
MKTVSGVVAENPQEVQSLQQEGFTKCRNPMCDYWLSPQESESLEDNYTFTCPRCKRTYPLLDPTAFTMQDGKLVGNPNPTEDYNEPLGIANRQYETTVGLSRDELGKLGEGVVESLKTIPGYGAITWWHPLYHNPIDGGTKDHAIEVKTIVIDAQNHRFVPGEPERKDAMIAKAQEMGYTSILGILVILDFRRSMADIYSMEMPLDPWVTQGGRNVQGPVAYRKHNGEKLVAEVPFKNPFLDPTNEEPQKYNLTGDDIPF